MVEAHRCLPEAVLRREGGNLGTDETGEVRAPKNILSNREEPEGAGLDVPPAGLAVEGFGEALDAFCPGGADVGFGLGLDDLHAHVVEILERSDRLGAEGGTEMLAEELRLGAPEKEEGWLAALRGFPLDELADLLRIPPVTELEFRAVPGSLGWF